MPTKKLPRRNTPTSSKKSLVNPLNSIYYNLFDIIRPTDDTLSILKKVHSTIPSQQKTSLWKQQKTPDRFLTAEKKKEKDTEIITIHINSKTQPKLVSNQCLQFKICTTPTEKILYVDLIFWFKNREECFGQKISIHQIMAFMKKVGRKRLGSFRRLGM
jgi:hypothetical protein